MKKNHRKNDYSDFCPSKVEIKQKQQRFLGRCCYIQKKIVTDAS